MYRTNLGHRLHRREVRTSFGQPCHGYWSRYACRMAGDPSVKLEYRPDDPAGLANPFPLYRRMQDEAPAHWSPQLKPWVLTRYDDVKGVCLDSGMSSDRLRP